MHTSIDGVVSKAPYLTANIDCRHPAQSEEVRVGFASMEPPRKSGIDALVWKVTDPKENVEVFPKRCGEFTVDEEVVKRLFGWPRATSTHGDEL